MKGVFFGVAGLVLGLAISVFAQTPLAPPPPAPVLAPPPAAVLAPPPAVETVEYYVYTAPAFSNPGRVQLDLNMLAAGKWRVVTGLGPNGLVLVRPKP